MKQIRWEGQKNRPWEEGQKIRGRVEKIRRAEKIRSEGGKNVNPFVRCLDLFWIFFKRWNHGLHRKGWLPQQEAPYHPNFSEILGHRKICLFRCRWTDPQAIAIPAGRLLISVSTSQLFRINLICLFGGW